MAISNAQKEKIDRACPALSGPGLGTIIQGLEGGIVAVNVDDTTIEVGGDPSKVRIKDSGVAAAKIGTGAVTETKIGTGAVTATKIGTGAVTETKIGALAVATAAIAVDAVDGTKIADASINSEHIAAAAVDPEHLASGVAFNIRERVTAAEVNAGKTLLTPPTGLAVRLIDCALIAIGGAASGATTVDILTGATKLVAAAVAGLTQSTLLRAGATNAAILADGASFVALAADATITIGKTGSDLATSTHIDVILTYALE